MSPFVYTIEDKHVLIYKVTILHNKLPTAQDLLKIEVVTWINKNYCSYFEYKSTN